MQDKDFYLYVDGMKIKVSEEIYLEWRRSEDKERYFMKTLKQGRVIIDGENMSVKYVPSREVSYEEYLDAQADAVSPDVPMDDLMVKAQLMERLEDALHILTEKEMELIQELFFLEKSEREAADLFHVSQNTIHYRKSRVLEKLKRPVTRRWLRRKRHDRPLGMPYSSRTAGSKGDAGGMAWAVSPAAATCCRYHGAFSQKRAGYLFVYIH